MDAIRQNDEAKQRAILEFDRKYPDGKDFDERQDAFKLIENEAKMWARLLYSYLDDQHKV